MKYNSLLDALLLGWMVTCVAASRSRTFLAQPESQSDLVAARLSVIEDDWQTQVAIFAQCEQGDKVANPKSCGKVEGLFAQSCTAISSAFVSGRGGDARAVTFFMDGVCASRVLDGWRRDTCMSLRGELLGAIATSQDGNLNSMGLCQRVWAHLLDRERLRGEDSKKDQEVKVLKEQLAKAQALAAKASEEQREKDAATINQTKAEAKKLEARVIKLQEDALNREQQQQVQQPLEKKRHAVEEQARPEIVVEQKEKVVFGKQKKDDKLAIKQKHAPEQQRQQEIE